jgi:hypothetical protein
MATRHAEGVPHQANTGALKARHIKQLLAR